MKVILQWPAQSIFLSLRIGDLFQKRSRKNFFGKLK